MNITQRAMPSLNRIRTRTTRYKSNTGWRAILLWSDYQWIIDRMETSMVSTVLVGFDASNNTITLQLPKGKSIVGLTTGQTVDVLLSNP